MVTDKVNARFSQELPVLYKTARTIWAFAMKENTNKQQMFLNFKMSYRGDIRKQPSVIVWSLTLRKLMSSGGQQWAGVVKEWNTMNNKGSQLVGAKATAVKSLLESIPPRVFDLIVAHVSKHTWEKSAFSEEGLATKKMHPGTKVKWERGGGSAVSVECLESLMHNLNSDWDDRLPSMKKKLSKKELEEKLTRRP